MIGDKTMNVSRNIIPAHINIYRASMISVCHKYPAPFIAYCNKKEYGNIYFISYFGIQSCNLGPPINWFLIAELMIIVMMVIVLFKQAEAGLVTPRNTGRIVLGNLHEV